MFGIEIDLLTGRYTAARHGDRDQPEWPPHPARLLSALVAQWAEQEPQSPAERAALSWLAEQGAPDIHCSEHHVRNSGTHFVPVNDAAVLRDHSKSYTALVDARRQLDHQRSAPSQDGRALARAQAAVDKAMARAVPKPLPGAAGLALLPDRRGRQGRTYPTAIPHEPLVTFVWPDARPDDRTRHLVDMVAARVSRLGHSSSQVSVRVVDGAQGDPAWVPDETGGTVLRAPAAGLVDALERAHGQHQGTEPRVLPAAFVSYRSANDAPSAGEPPAPLLGDDWIVLSRAEGPALPLQRALDVTRMLRAALLHHADEPVPEMLTGHAPGRPGAATAPTTRPHLAIVALPFVDHPHATGALLGAALVLPRDADPDERRAVARAAARWRQSGAQLTLGRSGIWTMAVTDDLDPRLNLRPMTWCRPRRQWRTATPIALDRTPRHLFRGTAAQRDAAAAEVAVTIARSCVHAGLPLPAHVELVSGGHLDGVPPQRAFPPFLSGGGRVQRLAVHARIDFDEPVRGPVLLGAGRYLGYGLCRGVGSARQDVG